MDEAEGARRQLVKLADTWLEKVDPSHPRWAAMWLFLWNAARSCSSGRRDFLVLRGRGWLEGQGERVEWQAVWGELWSIPSLRDDAMRRVARSRLNILSGADIRLIEDQLLM